MAEPYGKRDAAWFTVARETLAVSDTLEDAARKLGIGADNLRHTFARHGRGSPVAFLRGGSGHSAGHVGPIAAVARGGQLAQSGQLAHGSKSGDSVKRAVDTCGNNAGRQSVRPELAPLLAAVRAGAVDFATLCNRLDMAPRRVRALIDDARSAGHAVEVAHDHVGVVLPEPSAEVVDTGVAPSTGKRQQIAAFSDTQFGSKYCMREAIVDFVKHAYAQGCREVLHAGDWLDGCYKHGIFELSHSGIEDQTRDSFETLPELPGLSYHAISGNHDDTFADATGMAPGDYIEWYFRQHGRNDVHFYGRRGAYLKVRGATVELWHPKRGTSYALSYHLQNHIRDYGVGQKPDILVAGHWHINCYLEQRGVHAIAAPCFQSPGSAFSKSLGGAPSIGGLILSWELTEARTLRRFSFERSSYFMREDLRELELA